MGKVKSFRLNQRTERMFNVIKSYREKKGIEVRDTEIIAEGIEKLYDELSVEINVAFAEKMKEALKMYPEAGKIFEQVYDNLEVPCIMNGDIMQDEFWGFFVVNEEGGSFYDVNSETGERTLVNKQYEKIYDIVYKNFADSESFEENMATLHSVFFEEYGEDYGRTT
ncbi:MAG: hypothetical protein ACLRZ9_13025 [Eubacterium sp.]